MLKMPIGMLHNFLKYQSCKEEIILFWTHLSECEPQGKHVNDIVSHLEVCLNEQINMGRLWEYCQIQLCVCLTYQSIFLSMTERCVWLSTIVEIETGW